MLLRSIYGMLFQGQCLIGEKTNKQKKKQQVKCIGIEDKSCPCEGLRPIQQLRSCRAGQFPINTVPGQAFTY